MDRTAERRAATILGAIAILEGWWVYINLRVSPAGFARYIGVTGGQAGISGWLLALTVFLGFTGYAAARFAAVREYAFAWSPLKLLGLAVAVTAALCEEALFRKFLMDRLARADVDAGLQVLASAGTFGFLHGVWGLFRGSVIAAIGATVATGVLGAALAVVYLASHRVLVPCVVCHLLINIVIEPGLMIAAVRGEMARRS